MSLEPIPQALNWHEIIRTAGTLVTVVLALINLLYAVKIFRHKDKKEDDQKQKDIRAAAFKNLVLDHSLDRFFVYFSEIETKLSELKRKSVSLKTRKEVNEYVLEKSSDLRRNFVDLIRAVSDDLYDDVLSDIDSMSDRFTDDIFQLNLDFSDSTTYDSRISNRLSSTKTTILKRLVEYDGKEDQLLDCGLSILPRQYKKNGYR